jgi:hypothetical protein
MKTVTAEQFKKIYGGEAINYFSASQKISSVSPEQKLTDIVGTDINNRVNRVGDILNRPDTGAITKGVQVFGQGAGLAANTIEQTAMKVPGVKQAIGAIGAGINWLTTSDLSPVKALGDVVGNNKTLQTAVTLYDTDTNFRDTIDAVANIARLGGDVDAAINSANFATNVTNKVIRNVKATTGNVVNTVSNKISKIQAPEVSAGIMNRVARLKPTDMTTFEKMSGKTPGQYLTETGNFGAPDKIITTEAQKFTQSKAMVDMELEKLPGVYKDGAISDALSSLSEKIKNVSTENVPASYSNEVNDLIRKYNSGGLDMKEINQVKRLYERNVKLGYNKLLNADKVEQATNIDNAIRNWQIKKANDLGFKNITDLNKQTQLSKFIVNKLGDQIIGQGALNSIGLTDWIILAGGNPQAVAGFLTKKFFSSRAVQAKIAEILNNKDAKGLIQANVKPTVENALRTQWPQGTLPELPAPAVDANPTLRQDFVPIEGRPAGTVEVSAQKIFNQDMIKLNTKPPQPLPQEKLSGKSSPNTTTLLKETQLLAQEAKKYKTAEEFVKAQPKNVLTKSQLTDIWNKAHGK